MTGIVLFILCSTAIVVVCTIVFVCRVRKEAAPEQYLDVPPWSGSMAGGPITTDLTAPSAGAGSLAAPEGARIRTAADAGSQDSVAQQQQQQLVEEVLQGLTRFPPLPHVLFQILGELDNAGSTARSLASIVSTEPVLAAALLRVANSSAHGLRRRIISVDESVAYLGYSTVRSLVLRMKLAELMPQRKGRGYDAEHLWLHSLVVSQVASHLARSAHDGNTQLVSTIGLLHDIGKLAINSQFPDTVSKLWERNPNAPADESFLARERRLFGADHAFIGGFLAAQWRLPQELVDAIRLHHLPQDTTIAAMSPDLRRAVQIVHVANQLTKYLHVYCADMEIDIVPEHILVGLGLPRQLEDLLTDELRTVIHRAASMSGATTGASGPKKNAA
jgi:putative nucleotidyltransferase with HDIG domain